MEEVESVSGRLGPFRPTHSPKSGTEWNPYLEVDFGIPGDPRVGTKKGPRMSRPSDPVRSELKTRGSRVTDTYCPPSSLSGRINPGCRLWFGDFRSFLQTEGGLGEVT